MEFLVRDFRLEACGLGVLSCFRACPKGRAVEPSERLGTVVLSFGDSPLCSPRIEFNLQRGSSSRHVGCARNEPTSTTTLTITIIIIIIIISAAAASSLPASQQVGPGLVAGGWTGGIWFSASVPFRTRTVEEFITCFESQQENFKPFWWGGPSIRSCLKLFWFPPLVPIKLVPIKSLNFYSAVVGEQRYETEAWSWAQASWPNAKSPKPPARNTRFFCFGAAFVGSFLVALGSTVDRRLQVSLLVRLTGSTGALSRLSTRFLGTGPGRIVPILQRMVRTLNYYTPTPSKALAHWTAAGPVCKARPFHLSFHAHSIFFFFFFFFFFSTCARHPSRRHTGILWCRGGESGTLS